MPRYLSPGGPLTRFNWASVRGHVIRIPRMGGIAWWIPAGSVQKNNKITLQTLPAGSDTVANWTTVQSWLDKGEVTVSLQSYPSWVEALAANPDLLPSMAQPCGIRTAIR